MILIKIGIVAIAIVVIALGIWTPKWLSDLGADANSAISK